MLWRTAAAFALLALAVSGCGQDRASLAHKTVQTYWSDIHSAHLRQAYKMLTSGNRASTTWSDYYSNTLGFLTGTEGITAIVGQAKVDGDRAVVPVTLKSPKAPNPKDDLHAYQHLFWENGSWKIADTNGGLSHNKSI